MAKRTTKAASELTEAEKLAKEIEGLRRMAVRDVDEEVYFVVASLLEAGQRATQAFADDMNAYGLAHALEWAEGRAVEVALGELAGELWTRHWHDQTRADPVEDPPMSIEAWVRLATEQQREELLGNRYRGTSSSAFHNATQAARAEAASQFLSRFSYCVDRYARRSEARAKLAAIQIKA